MDEDQQIVTDLETDTSQQDNFNKKQIVSTLLSSKHTALGLIIFLLVGLVGWLWFGVEHWEEGVVNDVNEVEVSREYESKTDVKVPNKNVESREEYIYTVNDDIPWKLEGNDTTYGQPKVFSFEYPDYLNRKRVKNAYGGIIPTICLGRDQGSVEYGGDLNKECSYIIQHWGHLRVDHNPNTYLGSGFSSASSTTTSGISVNIYSSEMSTSTFGYYAYLEAYGETIVFVGEKKQEYIFDKIIDSFELDPKILARKQKLNVLLEKTIFGDYTLSFREFVKDYDDYKRTGELDGLIVYLKEGEGVHILAEGLRKDYVCMF